jgi:hypothetical protein
VTNRPVEDDALFWVAAHGLHITAAFRRSGDGMQTGTGDVVVIVMAPVWPACC